jgi:hypothetical protein
MRIWLSFVVLCGTACTDGGTPSKDSGTESTSGGLPEDSAGTTTPAPTGSLSGQVVDAAGAPIANATVNLCREVCKLDRTDASGAFSVAAEGGTWAFEVVVDPADPAGGWAIPLVPVEVTVDVDRVLDTPVVVPRFDRIVPLEAAGPVELTAGFTLTADPAHWDPPALTPSAEPWLAAAGFDFATSGLPLDGLTGTILAAWSVAPTGTHPTEAWPLTLANPGLETGTMVEVWVSDYATQAWVLAGSVQPSADGSILEGASLSTLGTVVLLAPSG